MEFYFLIDTVSSKEDLPGIGESPGMKSNFTNNKMNTHTIHIANN